MSELFAGILLTVPVHCSDCTFQTNSINDFIDHVVDTHHRQIDNDEVLRLQKQMAADKTGAFCKSCKLFVMNYSESGLCEDCEWLKQRGLDKP